MTLPVFICIRCRMSWPEQFLAYTFSHSQLCRWCQESEEARAPKLVYEPDTALTIAQLASRVMFGRQPRVFAAAWWCC